eukprot:Plantae.Rhodophyta-Rhodochaete_pulchella.ctg6451.p1 GENE.Plantae.Rhodophyta-Rhodochaete_pulchella.ctg6451~~Plantae.Rhodophyta-Rhodochaete_pulchella.ctg6451.p1  ORF type:complete len:352 (-),score=41.55 Plantae.Rhodophyta-Rhodochaete_pulchella.ctg6451:394-1449(-)
MILDTCGDEDDYNALDLTVGDFSAVMGTPHIDFSPRAEPSLPLLKVESHDLCAPTQSRLSPVTPVGSQELLFSRGEEIVVTRPVADRTVNDSPNSISRTSSMVSGISTPLSSRPKTKSNEFPGVDVHVGRIDKTKKLEGQKQKSSKIKKPSKYCHLCGHTAPVDHRVLCRNIAEGTCRKTICRSCFLNQGWNFEECSQNPSWECSHCRGECPQRAQCTYYARTNRKRHISLMMKKSEKETDDVVNLLETGSTNLENKQVAPLPLLPSEKPNAIDLMPSSMSPQMLAPPPTGGDVPGEVGFLSGAPADCGGPNVDLSRIPDFDLDFGEKGDSAELPTSELTLPGGDSWFFLF